MDTEIMLPYHDFDIEGITIVDFTDEDLQIIRSYVEITRHVQEIHQLFELFQYNLKRLISIYELNNGDRLTRHVPHFEDFSDRIELNALVINYISSGKTLMDSLQSCIRSTYSKDSSEYDEFFKFLTLKYDDCFSYRLSTRLRDFAQHGHLPVSVIDDIVCFDIAQIIDTPHFNHNKAIFVEMEKFNEELLVKQKVQSHYVFTLAIAEYTASMCNIYHRFWVTINSVFLVKNFAVRILTEKFPESIVHKNKRMSGWLFYLVGSTLHAFNATEDSLAIFSQYLQEAEQVSKSQEKELKELQKSIKIIEFKE